MAEGQNKIKDVIKLKSLEIANYRSCLKTKIDLPMDLMCLIGINGTGKTNILLAFLLLSKIKGSSSKEVTAKGGAITSKISGEIEINKKNASFRVEFTYDTDEKNADEILTSTLHFNFSKITRRKEWIVLPSQFLNYIDNFSSTINGPFLKNLLRSMKSVAPTEREISLVLAIRNYFKQISYYSASQFSDPSKCPISFEIDVEYSSVRSRRISYHHEKFLTDLYQTSISNLDQFELFKSTVGSFGMGLIEEFEFRKYDMPFSSFEVKSGGQLKELRRIRQLIIPYITIGETKLSPNQLSEGTFKTLALVYYILMDNNPILLIEEPEVCVHHGLLNSILELIKVQSRTKQIIISTHSDFVLDRLAPANVLIVTKEVNAGTLASSLTNSLSKDDFAALKEYLLNTGNLGTYWREGGLSNES